MSLPSGYKRLKYIQSSGTQYIDTEFKNNQNSRICMVIKADSPSATSWAFGGRTSNTRATMGVFWYPSNSAWTADYNGNGQRYAFGSSIRSSDLLTIDFNKNVLLINGKQKTFTSATFQSTASIVLLAVNTGGKVSGNISAKLYSCQIYDNGTLIRDYIPCQTVAGDIGLWDDVNRVFYGNAGSGTFMAGPVIAIVADASEITKLEYIQSSGTQYIDTGFKPKNTTHVICDFQFENTAKTQYLFCARGPSSGYANRYGLLLNSAGYFRSDYGSANKNFPTTVALAGRHTVDKNGLSCTIDDTTVTNTAKTFTGSYNLYLFAGNTGGSMSEPASVKIYSCQIYDNDVLVRDFIAAKLSDGTVGLYDKLSGLLYINAGTGTFEAGPSSLNLPVNIGGTWKNANEAFVNIGGTWKTVEAAFVNIGGTWKELG